MRRAAVSLVVAALAAAILACQPRAEPPRLGVHAIHAEATRHRLVSRGVEGYWLEVTWAIRNDTAQPAHLLVMPPGAIADADPLVLEHTARDGIPSVSALAPVNPSFREIGPGTAIELDERYPLPPWDFAAGRSVVGRFGVGATSPDPGWAQHPPWATIAAWQTVVAARPFTIRS